MNDRGAVAGDGGPAANRFVTLFSRAPFGIALTDADGVIVEVNTALATLLGRNAEELRDTRISELAHTEDDATTLRSMLTIPDEEGPDDGKITVVLEHQVDGPVHTHVTVCQLDGDRPDTSYPMVLVEDVNDLHLLHETLRKQTVHDQLTGLPNATSFRARLESAMADRSAPTIALIYFDVDGFRIVNDGLGADAGDLILREVAGRIRGSFAAEQALVARLTGDGFGVLLHGSYRPQDVVALVEHALGELREPVYVDAAGVGVSASAGIVVRDVGDGAPDDLVRAAEITLHRAKEAGRAQWVLFDAGTDQRERHRYRRAASVAGALETGQFELMFHPTVRPDGTDRVVAAHTDVRWNHPDEGPLAAEEFLPLSEATGMALAIGRWMLSDAVGAAARWRAQDGAAAPDVSVLLPARLAVDQDLVGIVRSELHRHDLPAEKLCVAACAGTVRDSRGEVVESLSLLAELGVQVDLLVTTGSDLDLVLDGSLPAHHIVLSGAFVDAVDETEAGAAAVAHIRELVASPMARGMGVAAAGVRTRAQVQQLHALGIVAVRGPFFSPGLDADGMHELLAKQSTAGTGS